MMQRAPYSFLRPTLTAASIALLLGGCATLGERPTYMEDARLAVNAARADGRVATLAPAELNDATATYARTESTWRDEGDSAETRHLAYLARQRAAIAQQAATLRGAERAITAATAERERVRLAARTREAEQAALAAQLAQARADATQREALAARQQALSAQEQARIAQEQAAASQSLALASQQQAEAARARTLSLEAQLRELDARNTDRGLVVTLGDVLFDTGSTNLRSGGMRMVDRLAAFLREYPQRSIAIEGFTDSVGNDASNQLLSERRAAAVRAALMNAGIDGSRVFVQGFGEAFPVASNDTPVGRQLNRRVEIVISDEGGRINPRVAGYTAPR
jgi:outer membrane protein OmpA-like peptidoglycan-associated protein